VSWYKVGAYIWTVCGAGWFVIGMTLGMVMPVLVSCGCLLMAAAFLELE
jgi:hypothetical protein